MKLKKLVLSAAFAVVSSVAAHAFELTSPDTISGGTIDDKHVYNGFGCKGGDLSPALHWSDPPAGTKSFAVLVHDPDAPTGGAGFWHWVVYDIPASVTGLPEGVGKDGKGLPEGAKQIATDFGEPGYGGPCPPKGDMPHRYHFTVYALKVSQLDIPPHATASLVGFLVNSNAIGKSGFVATYGR